MKQRVWMCVVLMLLGLGLCRPEPAQATTEQLLEASSPQEITNGMANKLVRGVANVLTGWAELPKQVYVTYREEGLAKSMTVGPLKGIGMILVRTASGMGEAVTFFIPYPGFFDPYFEPEYVWQKE